MIDLLIIGILGLGFFVLARRLGIGRLFPGIGGLSRWRGPDWPRGVQEEDRTQRWGEG